jgi:hypothetical protein
MITKIIENNSRNFKIGNGCCGRTDYIKLTIEDKGNDQREISYGANKEKCIQIIDSIIIGMNEKGWISKYSNPMMSNKDLFEKKEESVFDSDGYLKFKTPSGREFIINKKVGTIYMDCRVGTLITRLDSDVIEEIYNIFESGIMENDEHPISINVDNDRVIIIGLFESVKFITILSLSDDEKINTYTFDDEEINKIKKAFTELNN